MFLFHRPSIKEVERFLAESRELPLSYSPVGLTREPRAGFDLDEQVTIVGSGETAFLRATMALAEWKHFVIGWAELFPKRASIDTVTAVAVHVDLLGSCTLS